VLLGVPQNEPLLHVAPKPIDHSGRHAIVPPVEVSAHGVMRDRVLHQAIVTQLRALSKGAQPVHAVILLIPCIATIHFTVPAPALRFEA
jgi:hypothetical protein